MKLTPPISIVAMLICMAICIDLHSAEANFDIIPRPQKVDPKSMSQDTLMQLSLHIPSWDAPVVHTKFLSNGVAATEMCCAQEITLP